MDATEYQKRAKECLARVEAWLEDFDPDELDFTPSDGVVTMEFGDGTRYVLNRQAAASQIWFAAVDRAWHFVWDEEREAWIDDKGGRELYELVAECVGSRLGRAVSL